MPFLTIAGENKLAQNQSVSGGLAIVSFVLANVPDLGTEPDDRIENMPNASLIVDTLDYTKRGYVNPNQVIYSLVMGSDVGDYDFNWIGLVDEDGVLIAVSYTPTIQKRKNDGGISGNTFTRNFLLKYIGIQSITATTVPVETWQIDFNTRLNGIDERERLSNLDIYGHESFLDDGWLVTESASPYTLTAGIGYVSGIRAKNSSTQQLAVPTKPNSIWLDVSLQGDISDMSTVVEIVVNSTDQSNYNDANGISHFLTKIADIASDGTVTDTRVIYQSVEVHEAKDDPHPQYMFKTLSDKNRLARRVFTVSGDENHVILTSNSSDTKVTELSDYDEFSFIVTETNTGLFTIKIDELTPISLAGVVSETQIFETALLTVRYLAGSFYIVEQVNPKTGNNVLDIAKLWTDTTDILRPGEYALDGSIINSKDHPIACAIAAASSNYIAQETKDNDPINYGGYYGFVDEDGSTAVSLPMVGGEFIRMFDDGRGVNPDQSFGGWKADELKAHNHNYSVIQSRQDAGNYGYTNNDYRSVSANTGTTGGDETRPRAISYYGKTRL